MISTIKRLLNHRAHVELEKLQHSLSDPAVRAKLEHALAHNNFVGDANIRDGQVCAVTERDDVSLPIRMLGLAATHVTTICQANPNASVLYFRDPNTGDMRIVPGIDGVMLLEIYRAVS